MKASVAQTGSALDLYSNGSRFKSEQKHRKIKSPSEEEWMAFVEYNFRIRDGILTHIWVEDVDWKRVNPKHKKVIAFMKKSLSSHNDNYMNGGTQ